jgi:hypothetical protein
MTPAYHGSRENLFWSAMYDLAAEPHPDFAVDMGDGNTPATVDEFLDTFALMAVLHPDKCPTMDDDFRKRVERVRRQPRTRRLVLKLQAQTRRTSAPPIVFRTAPRARGQRRRVFRRASRRGPPSLGGEDPEPPSFDVGRFAVASVRLWAHERRRIGARRRFGVRAAW